MAPFSSVGASAKPGALQVQIELSGEEYHLAVTAHDQKVAVACSGDVHVKSKSATMTRKGTFRIIAPMDLFKN
jgi:hypothetical protein